MRRILTSIGHVSVIASSVVLVVVGVGTVSWNTTIVLQEFRIRISLTSISVVVVRHYGSGSLVVVVRHQVGTVFG